MLGWGAGLGWTFGSPCRVRDGEWGSRAGPFSRTYRAGVGTPASVRCKSQELSIALHTCPRERNESCPWSQYKCACRFNKHRGAEGRKTRPPKQQQNRTETATMRRANLFRQRYLGGTGARWMSPVLLFSHLRIRQGRSIAIASLGSSFGFFLF